MRRRSGPESYCTCGYRRSAHPTVAGCQRFKFSKVFNGIIDDEVRKWIRADRRERRKAKGHG